MGVQLYTGNLPPHVRKPGGRGVQLYTGLSFHIFFPPQIRKPGGRGVQLKLPSEHPTHIGFFLNTLIIFHLRFISWSNNFVFTQWEPEYSGIWRRLLTHVMILISLINIRDCKLNAMQRHQIHFTFTLTSSLYSRVFWLSL